MVLADRFKAPIQFVPGILAVLVDDPKSSMRLYAEERRSRGLSPRDQHDRLGDGAVGQPHESSAVSLAGRW